MGIFCGIDPGKSGCLCILDNDRVHFYDWPKDDNISIYLNRINSDLNTKFTTYVSLTILEKVHAMPKQGVTSMFNFGMNFGIWQGFLTMIGIPYRIVTPQQWMKGLVTKSDGPDTKSAVKNVATRLFPKAELYGTKNGYKDGRGDALLMAYYASQQKI